MEQHYKKVTESLKLLASSFEDQKRYLPDFADVPDEVTSSFENAFLLLPSLVEDNKFSNRSIALLLRLYNKMQWCLRNLDFNDFSNAAWNILRVMARETLQAMGEPMGKPDSNYI